MSSLWKSTCMNGLISTALFFALFCLLWLIEWLFPSLTLLHWNDAAWVVGIPASVIGVAYVLSIRNPQNYTGFYPGILMSILLSVQFLLQGNYDLTALYLLVFVPFQARSIRQWKLSSAEDIFTPQFLSIKPMLLSLLVFLLIIVADYMLATFIINHDTLADNLLLKLMGGLMISSSVLANFWLIYRKTDAWLYWVVYSLSGIVFYVLLGNAFSIVLFCFFLVINSLAGISWIRNTH